MSVHTFQGFVKVEGHKLWLDIGKILSIIHSIVKLVLEPIEVTDSPFDFVPKTFSLLIVLVLFKLLCDVHPLNIKFKRTQLITSVKNIYKGAALFRNAVMIWFF